MHYLVRIRETKSLQFDVNVLLKQWRRRWWWWHFPPSFFLMIWILLFENKNIKCNKNIYSIEIQINFSFYYDFSTLRQLRFDFLFSFHLFLFFFFISKIVVKSFSVNVKLALRHFLIPLRLLCTLSRSRKFSWAQTSGGEEKSIFRQRVVTRRNGDGSTINNSFSSSLYMQLISHI